MFARVFDDVAVDVHCFFGLGLESSDRKFMSRVGAAASMASDLLVRASAMAPPLKHVADSVYVTARVE